MWTTTPDDGTSLHANMMDRLQASETVPADDKKTHRLYPSLPNIDRYDMYVPKCATEQKLRTAMEFQPKGLLEDKQSEESAASSHDKMKAQMLILEEQREELISINGKWAKEYRTMVQYYKEKVRSLKALLQQNHSHCEDKVREEEEQHMVFHKKLIFNKDKERKWAGDGEVISELLKAKEETKQLRVQNSTLTQRWQQQREEIQRLNKALEEALLMTQPLDCSETLQDLWKHQAEVYKEDFSKERKDREKLKDKYVELKNKFVKVHNELCAFKSQSTWTPAGPVPQSPCTNQAQCSNFKVCPVHQHHTRLQRHHAVEDKQ